VACRTASAGHAAGVLALAFPLHPPGHPERSRVDELAEPTVPVLVVHGTADPFGTVAELRRAITLVPAPTQLLTVEGAGHDLRRGRFDLAAVVASVLQQVRAG
jgi:predicted alpha/beta-hydrolase family hydrolase